MEKDKFLRSKEAAETLGLKSRSSMRVLEKRGLIHSVRDWAGHRRFSEHDVIELRKSLFPGQVKDPLEAT
jgi:DNA-binding transcriptional MerR regulator